MVVKLHFDLANRRRLAVLGRNIAFWIPGGSATFYEADYTAGY